MRPIKLYQNPLTTLKVNRGKSDLIAAVATVQHWVLVLDCRFVHFIRGLRRVMKICGFPKSLSLMQFILSV